MPEEKRLYLEGCQIEVDAAPVLSFDATLTVYIDGSYDVMTLEGDRGVAASGAQMIRALIEACPDAKQRIEEAAWELNDEADAAASGPDNPKPYEGGWAVWGG